MNVLITSAASPLAGALAAALSVDHRVRMTDLIDVDTDCEFVRCDLGHEEPTDRLVAGMDAIVHLAQVPPSELEGASHPDNRLIDTYTRCTYNLLVAASEAGVSRVIYASTLRLFEAGDDDWLVNEVWAPRPTPDAEILGPYMGEFVCREFAREGKLDVVCLRLGSLVQTPDTLTEPASLSMDDAARAFQCALKGASRPWAIYHIHSGGNGTRFSLQKAGSELGFEPQSKGEG